MTHNQKIIQELQLYQNWSERTLINKKITIKQYEQLNGLTIEELIQEAENEEQELIPIKQRKIKQRLLNFQLHLQENNYQTSTIKNKMNNITGIYHFYEITVPKLPRLVIKTDKTLKDIPTYNDIKKALENTSNNKMRALITLMASSGMARNEISHLTIQDFIDATSEYHNNSNDINYAIGILEHTSNIIPTWQVIRLKTNYLYYTFSSNESSKYIIQMLKQRMKRKLVTGEDSLFELGNAAITVNFQRLNDKLEYGWLGNRRFLHPHNIRKFFATTLFNEGLEFINIEFMLGHRIGKTQEAYIKSNPLKQKQKYLHFVDKLSFFEKVNYISITDKEKRELEMLKSENLEIKERMLKLEEMMNIFRDIED